MDERTHGEDARSDVTSARVTQLLNRLRGRIRGYVALEAIAIVTIWVLGVMLALLAIDYLPVLFGLTELPWVIRLGFTVVWVGGALVLLWRTLLSRIGARLSDRSMALLIEKYHGQFEESLVTTVELATREHEPGSVDPEMLAEARRQAEVRLSEVRLGTIFNRRRLAALVAVATLLVVGLAVLGVWRPIAVTLGIPRLLLLDSSPWPRRSQIEILGLRIVKESANPALPVQSLFVPFDGRVARVARGATVVLEVRANGPSAQRPNLRIPGRCIVYYRSRDGQRGYEYMEQVGSARDGDQAFELDKSPFSSLMADLTFDVRGDDHRLNGYRIEVVQSPTVVQAEVACEYPDYLRESGLGASRTVDLQAGLQLPVGTTCTLQLKSNKPLASVVAYDPVAKTTRDVPLGSDAMSFSFPVESIRDDVAWDFTLIDQDGVPSDLPYRAEILAYRDQAPKIRTQLVGIGDAITPDARVPFTGVVEDDFGVADAWIDVLLGAEQPPRSIQEAFSPQAGGAVDAAIDFREKRQDRENGFSLPADEGAKIKVAVTARDRYDLEGDPHQTTGESIDLEIVSPSQLLRILERKEALQRRLLVQIYDELTDGHNLLVRLRGLDALAEGREPGDTLPGEGEPGDAPPAVDALDDEVRFVFAQRAWLQLQKSRQELLAVADTFDDIRLQLINNRVDSEDRKERIKVVIVDPLHRLVEQRFATADQRVLDAQRLLERRIQDPESVQEPQVVEAADLAIEEMQLLLVDLDAVIQELVDFESYSELLEVVREMIRQQEALLDETEKERDSPSV